MRGRRGRRAVARPRERGSRVPVEPRAVVSRTGRSREQRQLTRLRWSLAVEPGVGAPRQPPPGPDAWSAGPCGGGKSSPAAPSIPAHPRLLPPSPSPSPTPTVNPEAEARGLWRGSARAAPRRPRGDGPGEQGAGSRAYRQGGGLVTAPEPRPWRSCSGAWRRT